MQTEIERKFLVTSDAYKQEAHNHSEIVQGFLNKDKNRTVRIRLKDKRAFLTVKGISSQSGLSRLEWEIEIDYADAKNLLELCEKPVLHKTRYDVIYKGKLFEVDEFHKNHSGLVIAEIELDRKEEKFEKPNWLGKEVTGDKRYYNSQL
jgi:CYTH domain-containing protein